VHLASSSAPGAALGGAAPGKSTLQQPYTVHSTICGAALRTSMALQQRAAPTRAAYQQSAVI